VKKNLPLLHPAQSEYLDKRDMLIVQGGRGETQRPPEREGARIPPSIGTRSAASTSLSPRSRWKKKSERTKDIKGREGLVILDPCSTSSKGLAAALQRGGNARTPLLHSENTTASRLRRGKKE